MGTLLIALGLLFQGSGTHRAVEEDEQTITFVIVLLILPVYVLVMLPVNVHDTLWLRGSSRVVAVCAALAVFPVLLITYSLFGPWWTAVAALAMGFAAVIAAETADLDQK